MTSKFAALAANSTDTFRVEILHPQTGDVLTDKAGNPAYVEVYSLDSERAREFEKEERGKLRREVMRSRSGKVDPPDQFEQNIAKAAVLTKAWHLVDLTGETIDVPCTRENAAELYGMTAPLPALIFKQVWLGCSDPANFIRTSSTSSSATPSMKPGEAES